MTVPPASAATPEGLFVALLAARPEAPLVTWYDETPGRAARVELSARSLANWAAKTAGLLTDELGLGPGDSVLVEPFDHWLVPGLLLGAWHAGVEVLTSTAGAVAAAVVVRGGTFATAVDADEVFTVDPVSPFQLGAPDDAPGAPPGSRDLPTALRPHPDRLGATSGHPSYPALDGVDGSDLASHARDRVAALDLTPGHGRLLWSGGLAGSGLVDALLTPWAVGGSLVLVTGAPSPDRVAAIAAAEAVDVVR